jgi:DNA-binding NarL/FixJ family response regulator
MAELKHFTPAASEKNGVGCSDACRGASVLVADQYPIFREGLKGLLVSRGYAVVGEAAEPAEALQLAIKLQPNLLLLGVSVPQESTFEPLEHVARAAPAVRTIVLAARSDHHMAIIALQRGAHGVLLKDSTADVLFVCIESVLQDEYWLHGDQASKMVRMFRRPTAGAEGEAEKVKRYGLTRREVEIIGGVVAGESNREIANRLSVREDTVKHHVSKVFDKLGVFSRVELAVFAMNHGLVPNDDVVSSSVAR